MTITTANLNLRVGPGTSYPVITVIPKGTAVTLVQGGAWSNVYYKAGTAYVSGWCSADYLQSDYASTRASVVGVHVVSGPYGDLIGVAERLHKAGKPIPLVVIVNHTGLGEAIKRVSPSTVTVGRSLRRADDDTPDLKQISGRAWFAERWPMISQMRGCDYLQFDNEIRTNHETDAAHARRLAEHTMALMDECDRRGVKMTVGNFAPGHVETWHEPELIPLFREAARRKMPLNYHCYGGGKGNDIKVDAAYMVLRFRRWLDAVPDLKVIAGEAGFYEAPRYRAGHFVPLLNDLQALLAGFPQVVGAALWTTGGTVENGWAGDDFTPQLGIFEAWMKG